LSLTKKHLQENFRKAREVDSPYVFIGINADGIDELIVIPKRSFDAKEKFYLDAYSDDLTHVMNKNVYIRDLSYREAKEIENII